MKIPIPKEICERLGLDSWACVNSENQSELETLIREANIQLETIASSIVSSITRSRPIQQFKETCLTYFKD